VSLGSNVGDREAHLLFAVAELRRDLADVRVSSFHDTAPVDVDGPQPRYLNAAVVGRTSLTARALLDRLLALERSRGRERPSPRAPRTLDLDLILYGDAVINEPGLIVPHPEFHRRAFVLDPLVEIAGQMFDPRSGLTVEQLRAARVQTERAEQAFARSARDDW
jgi:2-amino-4-hydroxy-6-hydroxymethyldihydropteridine diphosphokinase